MAFLDENGLAELWDIVKEKDRELAESVKDLWRYCWEKRHIKKTIITENPPTSKQVLYKWYPSQEYWYVNRGDGCVIGENGKLQLTNPERQFCSENIKALDFIRGHYFYIESGNFNNGIFNTIMFAEKNAAGSEGAVSGLSQGYQITITCSTVSTTEEVQTRVYEFSDSKEAHEDETPINFVQTEDGAEYDIYYFLGSIVGNSLAYYKLNPSAVFDALLGLEGITHE